MVALIAAGLVHLVLAAAIATGWQRTQHVQARQQTITIIALPAAADEQRRQPAPGAQVPDKRPHPQQPAISLPQPPVPVAFAASSVAQEVTADKVDPAEGGQDDRLAVTTQTYRRLIMARLEAQRTRRQDMTIRREGAAAILFRIDRAGTLLELSIFQSTGRSELDHAALAIVRRAAPFPAIPDALPDELAITLPVEFLFTRHDTDLAAR